MAYNQDGTIGKFNTIMGNGLLAKLYRSRVCGYCAQSMPLHQVVDPCRGQWEPEYWHIDPVDECYYPCAVVAEQVDILRDPELRVYPGRGEW